MGHLYALLMQSSPLRIQCPRVVVTAANNHPVTGTRHWM